MDVARLNPFCDARYVKIYVLRCTRTSYGSLFQRTGETQGQNVFKTDSYNRS
jgi:hypothetical protein